MAQRLEEDAHLANGTPTQPGLDREGTNSTIQTRNVLAVIAVLALSAISAFWSLSTTSLDSHECFVSVTAREMLESGDWVFPTMNGNPRLNKTPLSYWLVASLAKVTGRVDEFTTRLPSAVFAFLSAVAILYFVSRWLSLRIALISTAVWATSLGYVRCSHIGRPDMALAFFIIICFLCFYSAITAKTRRSQVLFMLAFWTSLGLGNLAKGPAPIPYVFIPLLAYIAFRRQWKIVPKLLPIVGPIILLAITLPWPLAIAHRVNWDLVLWKKEFVDRFFGDYARGRYPIYYYFIIMFKYIVPWVAFLLPALRAPFRNVWETKKGVMKFLWIWFVADIIFLTINAGKRQHYILPLMPALSILIAILFEDIIFVRRVYSRGLIQKLLIAYLVIIGIPSLVGPVAVAIINPPYLLPSIALGVVTIAGLLWITLLSAKNEYGAVFSIAIFGTVLAWIMIALSGFSLALDDGRFSRSFARKVAQIVPDSGSLVAFPDISDRFVQYFGQVVPIKTDKPTLHEAYERGDWIVCTSGYLSQVTSNDRLRTIYSRAEDENGKEDSGGAVFHKSAPILEDNY